MNFLTTLMEVSTVVDPNAGKAAANTAKTVASGSTSLFGMSPAMALIFYTVVFLGIFYFVSIRPERKRQKKIENLRKQIKPGSTIVISNGMFGKVVDITVDCFVVEFGLNKSISIPVLKKDCYLSQEPNLTNKELPKEETEEKK